MAKNKKIKYIIIPKVEPDNWSAVYSKEELNTALNEGDEYGFYLSEEFIEVEEELIVIDVEEGKDIAHAICVKKVYEL